MGPETLLGVAFGGIAFVVLALIAAYVAGYSISSSKNKIEVAWKDETIERLRAEVKAEREQARAVAESRRRTAPGAVDDVLLDEPGDRLERLLGLFPPDRALPPADEATRDPRRVG